MGSGSNAFSCVSGQVADRRRSHVPGNYPQRVSIAWLACWLASQRWLDCLQSVMRQVHAPSGVHIYISAYWMQLSRKGAKHLVPLRVSKRQYHPHLWTEMSGDRHNSAPSRPQVPFLSLLLSCFRALRPSLLRLACHVSVPSCYTSTAVPRNDGRPMDRCT